MATLKKNQMLKRITILHCVEQIHSLKSFMNTWIHLQFCTKGEACCISAPSRKISTTKISMTSFQSEFRSSWNSSIAIMDVQVRTLSRFISHLWIFLVGWHNVDELFVKSHLHLQTHRIKLTHFQMYRKVKIQMQLLC
jgi:hypothetical protein